MKRKISVVTGSRADYGILRPLLEEISSSKKLKLYLIVTGMHLSKKHGLTIKEIKKDGFKIYQTVDMIPKGDSGFFMAEALGRGIIDFSKIFNKLKPDINLILGDRDESLASSIAASHMNIPNAHIHGGDKTQGGIDEYNRHAITKLSNIHFAATKKSKRRILMMGENPKYVFLTGSPSMDEVLNNKITDKNNLEKKYNLKFTGTEILLLQHPVTTEIEYSKKQIYNILNAIIKLKKLTIAILPNSDAGSQNIFKNLKSYSRKFKFIRIYDNLPRRDYLGMLKNCGVLVGNSSSGIIEASYFDTPVVNLGIRQRDREGDNNVYNIIDIRANSLYALLSKLLKEKKRKKINNKYVYGQGRASKKIVEYLEKLDLTKELIQKQIMY